MKPLPRPSPAFTWLLLVCITLASWGWGSRHALPLPGLRLDSSMVVLLLAFLKIRLIMRHFMEVGQAPAALRWICDGWVACTCLALLSTIRLVGPPPAQ